MAHLRRHGWITVFALTALLGVLLLLALLVRPPGGAEPEGFGSRPDPALQQERNPTPGGPGNGPSAGGLSSGSADSASAALPEPVRLSLPRVGLDARIDPVGVEADGTVEVPDDAARAGWYRFGPVPGSDTGSAVVVGHVDSRTGDLGALAALYSVRAGDRVTVAREEDEPVPYEVTAREVHPKDALPDEIFRRDGSPVLTLITCTGTFDPERGGYQSNLVVTAVPVGE
ncbi:class F sortase [Streptomyces sp. ACA25]|uniref:class F sortase n=1 Tax=Streptomyces sp. ACA25 TaxID=3022596 RepID=UPI0023076F65|nr:class F sortase [Streptomyces sp. ACA25]MDB1086131.1 class F sortase [Streptomyces sp. ACA25]